MNTKQTNTVSVPSGVPRLALSRVEVAATLGLHPGTIDRFVRDGKLRPSRASRRPLFALSEIERFLRETTFSAAA